MVCVVPHWRAGLTPLSARRSASLPRSMVRPASSMRGISSRQRHTCGTSAGSGSGASVPGTRHSGTTCAPASLS
ncbi:hypothetical protein SHIRM173S_00247 [Streptomyces hirsutus]